MKRRVALSLGFLILLGCSTLGLSNGLLNSREILSYGTINYRGISTLRVDGSRIVDNLGREVRLKGFNLWSNDIYYDWHMPLKYEHFKEIKDWGFNLVRNTGWWGKDFEPYKSQPGVYNEQRLARLEETVINAEKAGVYYLISMRVSFNDTNPPYWQGWGRHSYLLTEEGLQRYCNLWEMLVQRFDRYANVVGYCPWHFPWHQTNLGDEEARRYYEVITPRLVETIRRYSDKIIFWSPIKLGWAEVGGSRYQSGQYVYINPIPDENVVYLHEGYAPYSVSFEGKSWNYDIDFLEKQNSFAVDFASKHNVPMMIGEVGINWHDYPKGQSRLDCIKNQLNLFDKDGYDGWLDWIYTNAVSHGGMAVLNGDGTPTEVVGVLREYSQTLYG